MYTNDVNMCAQKAGKYTWLNTPKGTLTIPAESNRLIEGQGKL
ncbi:MAG: hypothetical protein WAM07_00970 [Halobacillus sp.]